MEAITDIAKALGVSLGIFYGWLKLSEKIEQNLRTEIKDDIALWLLAKDESASKLGHLPNQFAKVFDSIFGTKHLAWKCFWRSCLTSVSAYFVIAIVYFVWGLMGAILNGEYIAISGESISIVIFLLFISLISALAANLIPDYISLLETRFLLKYLSGKNCSAIIMLMLLMVDLFLTAAIFILIASPIYGELLGSGFYGWRSYEVWTERILFDLMPSDDNWTSYLWTLKIAFATTFITSIWLWLYMAGAVLSKFGAGYNWYIKIIRIEERPVVSIGLLGGIFASVIYFTSFGFISLL